MGVNTFSLLPDESLEKLNDQLSVIQPLRSYRFSMDAVLLSHFVRLKTRDKAVDLGTGCGVIPLLLYARESTVTVDALELDEASADRARRSMAGNGLSEVIRVHQGDLKNLPEAFPRGSFDLVTCNPPYGSTSPTGPDRVLPTTQAGCALEDVVLAAKALLRFSGRFAFCWPAARLQEAMTVLSQYRFAVKRLRPVCAKQGRGPYLCLIEAVFGGRPGLAFEPSLLVMDEEGRYTGEILSIYGDNGKENPI